MTESGSYSCSQCGNATPAREMTMFGADRVCPDCLPHYRQSIKEGVTPQTHPSAAGAQAMEPKLPTFVSVMVIMDLVFCGLRGLFALLGVVGIVVLMKQGKDTAVILGVFEVLTGVGIFLAGIGANVLILMKKRIGIMVAWVAVVVTVGSFIVGILSGVMRFCDFSGSGAQAVGFVVGAGGVTLFRLALLVAYIVALNMFRKFLDSLPQEERAW